MKAIRCDGGVRRRGVPDGLPRLRAASWGSCGTARIFYQDASAKTIAVISARAPTIAAFTSIANRIATDTEIAAVIGGTPVRDLDNEKYTATLRCRDANGETYFVSFSREQVALTSYSDEAIRSRVETWADTVPALG